MENVKALPNKKSFRKQVSFTSCSLLIYTFIFIVFSFIYMIGAIIISGIISGFKHETFDYDAFIEGFMETDVGMSFSVISGCIFMMLFFYNRIKPRTIFKKRKKKMNASKLFMLLCVLMSIQLPMTIIDTLFESALNMLGLTAEQAIESSKAGSTTISMMLYAGFIGPFAEELVYRGYTMQSLEKTGAGKGYALIISSMLFGIMHANPTQSLYAVFAGLVFGYTAIEYGIVWSMVLHISNNFLFGDVLIFITKDLSDDISNVIGWLLFLSFFFLGIITLIIKRKKAAEYIKQNFNTHSDYYKWTFASIPLWLFILGNVVMMFAQINKL